MKKDREAAVFQEWEALTRWPRRSKIPSRQ
jgi:hypothetical protein